MAANDSRIRRGRGPLLSCQARKGRGQCGASNMAWQARDSGVTFYGSTIRSFNRAIFVLVCVCIFAFQGYIAQTHIHAAETSAMFGLSKAAASLAVPPAHPGDKDQSSDDLSKCPFCQVSAALGNALWSGPFIVLAALSASNLALPQTDFARAQSTPAHVWRNRGPPSA